MKTRGLLNAQELRRVTRPDIDVLREILPALLLRPGIPGAEVLGCVSHNARQDTAGRDIGRFYRRSRIFPEPCLEFALPHTRRRCRGIAEPPEKLVKEPVALELPAVI